EASVHHRANAGGARSRAKRRLRRHPGRYEIPGEHTGGRALIVPRHDRHELDVRVATVSTSRLLVSTPRRGRPFRKGHSEAEHDGPDPKFIAVGQPNRCGDRRALRERPVLASKIFEGRAKARTTTR